VLLHLVRNNCVDIQNDPLRTEFITDILLTPTGSESDTLVMFHHGEVRRRASIAFCLA